ncbi:Amidase [Onchocerca flexuosa]|uniref:Amidase n=1 Tax=Onchocerca flexuosa TaxID=387005 RepID=A0A238BX70_9BILA|nr:Amidase [Onchocerca flexuosa]
MTHHRTNFELHGHYAIIRIMSMNGNLKMFVLISEMECVEKAISRAVKYRKFNSLITETFDLACVQAKEALKKGKTPFPVVVKDCYMTNKVRTTCASRNLSNFIAPYTATIVSRLFEQGGCLIGKANMDEFCMGTSSSKSHFGPVKNGLSDEANLETNWRSPGGSSGGCGVAVQLGISSISLGSDTGGSSRNPAAFTGLFGFKPSYGVLSRFGLIPLVNSLDCPSIIAKTVRNCNFLLQVMSGRDIFDSTCIDAPSSCFMQERPISGIIVGIPKEYHNETLSSECWRGWNEAAKALAVLGCKIKEVSMPSTTYSIICYHVLAEADITSNMASHYDEYFGQALRVRRLIKMDFDRVFREEDCDVLLTPVTSSIPPLFSEISDADGYKRECEDDFYTQPCNMAGVPAISVPFTKTADGFPIGVQIIADHLKDGLALDVAEKLYQYSDA